MSRRRRRASDIAPTPPRRGLAMLVVCAIALALVIAYKVVLGEQTAGFFTQITGESELELPPSVLDRLDAGPDSAPGTGLDPPPAD